MAPTTDAAATVIAEGNSALASATRPRQRKVAGLTAAAIRDAGGPNRFAASLRSHFEAFPPGSRRAGDVLSLCRKHETLNGRTPAMAAGLTSNAWTFRQLSNL